jgi:type I restriction enzyme S subunit
MVSCIGWQLGKAAMTTRDSFTNQQLNTVVPDRDVVSPEYLYYHLLTRRDEIRRLASGGTRTPILNKSRFEALVIPIPSLGAQGHIVAVLGGIDDLIENNRRRVTVLERMARAIHQEWFVRFRYPGHEDVPLTDSSLGAIPTGWNVRDLDAVIAMLESGSRPRGGVGDLAEGVPSIGAENVKGLGRHDFSKEKYISREFFDGMSRGIVESGDVLLYKDGAYIGRTSYVGRGYPHQECAVNEHVFRIRGTSELPQGFLYFALSSADNQERLRGLNSNAAQPGISQRKLRELQLVVPPSALTDRFEAVAEPMLSEALDLAGAVHRLAQLRELLLPKLVTGQIDVSHLDLDALTEAATV